MNHSIHLTVFFSGIYHTAAILTWTNAHSTGTGNLFPRSARRSYRQWKDYQDLVVSQTRENMSRLSLDPISTNVTRKRRAEDEEMVHIPQKRMRLAVGPFSTTDDLENTFHKYVDTGLSSSRSASLPPHSRRLEFEESPQIQPAIPRPRVQASPDIIGPSAALSDPFVDSGLETSRQSIPFILNRLEDALGTTDFGSSPPLVFAQATATSRANNEPPYPFVAPDEVEMGMVSDGSMDGYGDNLKGRRTLGERASKVYNSEP